MAKNTGFVSAAKSIKRRGTTGEFTRWCKDHGFNGVTNECIKKALKMGGNAAKMVAFAKGARTVAKRRKKKSGNKRRKTKGTTKKA